VVHSVDLRKTFLLTTVHDFVKISTNSPNSAEMQMTTLNDKFVVMFSDIVSTVVKRVQLYKMFQCKNTKDIPIVYLKSVCFRGTFV